VSIEARAITKSFGPFVALRNVSLTVPGGQLVALLGPSGSGKTSLLRIIAGLEIADSGTVLMHGEDATRQDVRDRAVGFVFQHYALFRHMSVFENVAFGLRMRKLDRPVIERRTQEALRLVRLDAHAERMPRQLSGGQQQRVALARALVIEPEILLLDEPLSNLDAKLREEVRVEIRQLQRRLGLTTVMVTHDQEEALSVADRLVVMSNGEIQQIGTQRELYNAPANQFVASFIGRTNFFAGVISAPHRFKTESGLEIASPSSAAGGQLLAIRPERVRLGNANGAANSFAGTIEFISYLGAITEYVVRLVSGDAIAVEMHNARPDDSVPLAIGSEIQIAWDTDACQLIA
jgi:putative spermidine/putrescine transport system ATP-binding protein